MANTSIGTKKKTDDESTTTYALGSGYSKSGRKLPTTAEEAIAAGRYLDDDGYWRTSSGYKLRTGTSQGGGYTSYDGVGGGYGGKNSASANSITDPIETDDGSSSVRDIYNYVNGIGEVGDYPTGSYTDPYDLTDIIDQLANMSYEDWTQGDQYRALADRYGLQADSAARDVLGQVMSRTGGLASSYAQTVANQQYNDYMAQLEEVAREMYQSDRSELEDRYKYMSDYNDTAYDRYRDELSDRQAAYDAALAAAQKSASSSKTSSSTGSKSSSSSSSKPTLTAAQTLTALKNGVVNATTKAAYEYYYGEPWDDGSDDGTTGTAKTGATLSDLESAYLATQKSGNSSNSLLNQGQSQLRNSLLKKASNKADYKTSVSRNTNGTIYWNGTNYSNINTLAAAIDNANLSSTQKETLKNKLDALGIDIEFD